MANWKFLHIHQLKPIRYFIEKRKDITTRSSTVRVNLSTDAAFLSYIFTFINWQNEKIAIHAWEQEVGNRNWHNRPQMYTSHLAQFQFMGKGLSNLLFKEERGFIKINVRDDTVWVLEWWCCSSWYKLRRVNEITSYNLPLFFVNNLNPIAWLILHVTSV